MKYMGMLSQVAVVFVLSACASVPNLPQQRSITVSDVVDRVNCELKEGAFTARFLMLDGKGWTAGTILKLKIVSQQNVGLDLNLASPLNPGAVTVSLGGSQSGIADRTASVTFVNNLAEAEKITCKDGPDQDGVLLTGNLGIYDWLQALKETKQYSNFNMKEFTYELEFTIERTGKLGAVFTAVPIGSSKFGAGPTLGGGSRAFIL